MKYSKQREMILSYVREHRTHPTAEIVYQELKKEYSNLSLGTVYRNLDRLSENGDVVRIRLANRKDCFDGNTMHHYHAICTNCGKITDIFTDCFSYIINEANQYIEGQVVSYDLIFNIICPDCQKIEGGI